MLTDSGPKLFEVFMRAVSERQDLYDAVLTVLRDLRNPDDPFLVGLPPEARTMIPALMPVVLQMLKGPVPNAAK